MNKRLILISMVLLSAIASASMAVSIGTNTPPLRAHMPGQGCGGIATCDPVPPPITVNQTFNITKGCGGIATCINRI